MIKTDRRIHREGLVLWLAGSLVLSAGSAGAAPASKAMRAASVQNVFDCRSVLDAARRLVCFDGAVGAMADAEANGDLVIIDREQRREVRRQAFGLTLPSLAMFDRGEKDADRITSKVVGVSRTPDGKWVLRLEGGALWRQTDDTDFNKTPRPGSNVVVKKGSLGSYFMKVDGGTAYRVHRDD